MRSFLILTTLIFGISFSRMLKNLEANHLVVAKQHQQKTNTQLTPLPSVNKQTQPNKVAMGGLLRRLTSQVASSPSMGSGGL